MFLGPRITTLIWWFVRPGYYDSVFNGWLWPVAALIFTPWTLLMYLIVAPGGVTGFDWMWMILAVGLDIFSYASGYYKRGLFPFRNSD